MTGDFLVQLSPNGGSFRCGGTQTILDAALAAGYCLPHNCRSGVCGSCVLEVSEGAVHYGQDEPLAGKLPGQCFCCQAYPLSDVTLEAPDMLKEPGRRLVATGAKVVALNRPSRDVAVVRLKIPASSGFNFTPGQYITVLLRNGLRRSYSIGNAANDEGIIELHVRRMEGGYFSVHAFDRLKVGDMLRIEGPFGTFVLQHGDTPVVLLASGTGYAPISALLEAHGAELAHRKAVLYWGGRTWEDLYAVDNVESWERRFPGVRLVPVLSEAKPDWKGRIGLVHAAVLADIPDLSAYQVYACGNPKMIDAARATFIALAGLSPNAFFSDAFVTNH